jgi:aminoglycoside phosphotransferase (APT) family kinase protein
MLAPGGSACAIHAVDVLEAHGLRHRLVLKRFVQRDWLAREPDLAEREARHLELVAALALPIPRLVAVDARADACDAPALLMTRLSGRVVLSPEEPDAWLRGAAETLRALHELPEERAHALEPYRHYGDPTALAVPAWSKRPEVWERVIARLARAAPQAARRFVHRDYHPGNLLWLQGRRSGVLDFTDSCCGPAAVDLGHCRLNLAQLHGPDCADRFLEIYAALAGGAVEIDPYWDLIGLSNLLPGPEDVYRGWLDLGVRHLRLETCWARLDDYAARVVSEL